MANETTAALPETRQHKRSVQDTSDLAMRYFTPFYNLQNGALPPSLPVYDYNGFLRPRDILLLSTVDKEDLWATAVSKAIAKVASRGWEIDSEIPLRRKRAQGWLKDAGAGMGLFGFVDFLTAHLSSYLLLGCAFVEIERESPYKGARIINIHHLNPLRCRLTGIPKTPVNYMADDGKVRALKWWQVFVVVDQLATTGNYGGYQYYKGAAERVYNAIRRIANLDNFIDEKVSGRRPLSINFVGGISKRSLDDALLSAQHEADSRSLRSYMGAAIVPVMSDQAVTNVSIPIAELPDITDVERERNYAGLLYANSIGLDPQEINPALLGRQGLGSTGNQSQVLADKDAGSGLAKWSKSFVEKLNQMALDESTVFSFIESDLRDQGTEADNAKKRADTRKTMIETGEITPEQSRNLAVDAGDLPREFLDVDATGADTLRDDEKPETPEEKRERDSRPEAETVEPKEDDDKGEGKTAVKGRSRGAAEQRAMFAKMGASGSLQGKGADGKRTGAKIKPTTDDKYMVAAKKGVASWEAQGFFNPKRQDIEQAKILSKHTRGSERKKLIEQAQNEQQRNDRISSIVKLEAERERQHNIIRQNVGGGKKRNAANARAKALQKEIDKIVQSIREAAAISKINPPRKPQSNFSSRFNRSKKEVSTWEEPYH